jgi:hypothetical protein
VQIAKRTFESVEGVEENKVVGRLSIKQVFDGFVFAAEADFVPILKALRTTIQKPVAPVQGFLVDPGKTPTRGESTDFQILCVFILCDKSVDDIVFLHFGKQAALDLESNYGAAR